MKRYCASPLSLRNSLIARCAISAAVSESTPPLMPSTRVFSRALFRQVLMKATRRVTSASSAALSANGGWTLSAWAISRWTACMNYSLDTLKTWRR
ncbi:hypothetical protein D3C78_1493820 [compost metagenome]